MELKLKNLTETLWLMTSLSACAALPALIAILLGGEPFDGSAGDPISNTAVHNIIFVASGILLSIVMVVNVILGIMAIVMNFKTNKWFLFGPLYGIAAPPAISLMFYALVESLRLLFS